MELATKVDVAIEDGDSCVATFVRIHFLTT
jgi:hypothetical protein